MSKFATKAAANMFCQARYEAAKSNERLSSREGAAEEIGIDRTRLARIELGSTIPYQEEVLLIRMVRTMYPSAVLNVFGDVNQCINCKGIMQLDDIPEEIYSDKYEIKENYRNAREITTYVKDNLNIAMEPYGLEGI